jgi:hypothetical protein
METPAISDPEKPASKSLEGKTSMISMASGVGAAIAGIITALTQLQAENPEAKWLGLFLAMAGVIQMMFTQISTMHKRTEVKLDQLELRKVEAQATAQIAAAQALLTSAATSAATNATQAAMAKMNETIQPAKQAVADAAAAAIGDLRRP